jgi:hypothetical protein
MKQFFSRITADHWTAKNRLEKAAHEVAREMDRRIILENQVELFISEMRLKIADLNKEYSKCKSLKLTVWQPEIYCGDHKDIDLDYDISFIVDYVFHLKLFLAKE